MSAFLTVLIIVSVVALAMTRPRPQQPILIQLEPVQPPAGGSIAGAILFVIAVLFVLSLVLPS